MKSRLLPALALATALGSTLFIAVRADAQQSGAPRVEERAAPGRGPMGRMSPDDRAAFFDARLAAMKAGLKLTPDQEKMWPALEDAVRDSVKKMTAFADEARAKPRPADPVEGMRRMADFATMRGETLKKIADAAQPLYASLSDDQKRRLPALMHGPRWAGAMRDRLRHWWNGDDRGPEGRRGFMDPRDMMGGGRF